MGWLGAFARTFERLAPALATWLPRLGIMLLALAAVFAGRSWWQDRALLHATATVTENIAAFAPGGGVLYQPRLRFRTPSGKNVQVLLAQGQNEPEFAAGTAVPVAWPSGNPQQAGIATAWRIYRSAISLALLGVVFFDAGWILRLRLYRKSPDPS
jgi:hypothetical protein